MARCEFCGVEFANALGVSTHQAQKHEDELPWRDKELLLEFYVKKGYGAEKLAERWGCAGGSVRRGLKQHGIPIRTNAEAQKIAQGKRPAHYRTTHYGYEEWKTVTDGNQRTVQVHRLAAVAWFGFDAVVDRDVHHKKPIPWLNTEENLQPKPHGLHTSDHISERVDEMVFDADGNIAGWSDVA